MKNVYYLSNLWYSASNTSYFFFSLDTVLSTLVLTVSMLTSTSFRNSKNVHTLKKKEKDDRLS